jgi:hypothetical protein
LNEHQPYAATDVLQITTTVAGLMFALAALLEAGPEVGGYNLVGSSGIRVDTDRGNAGIRLLQRAATVVDPHRRMGGEVGHGPCAFEQPSEAATERRRKLAEEQSWSAAGNATAMVGAHRR